MTQETNVLDVPTSGYLPVLLFLCTCYDKDVLSMQHYRELRRTAVIFHNAKANDMMAKIILRHDYGERIAILLRNWIRAQMDSSQELEDGGSGRESYENPTNDDEEFYQNAA